MIKVISLNNPSKPTHRDSVVKAASVVIYSRATYTLCTSSETVYASYVSCVSPKTSQSIILDPA